MKVCHVTSVHAVTDVRIFHKECHSLATAGHETFLVALNTPSRLEKGVNIIGVQSDYKNRLERMTKTVDAVLKKAISLDADVYHLHDAELLKTVKTFKKLGKKVIYDAHEDLPRQIIGKHWIPKSLQHILSYTLEKYENSVAKKCDAVICATPFITERFIKINPNTHNINNFPLSSEIEFTEPNFSTNKICYIGGISQIRGIGELITAVALTDSELMLAGSFSPKSFRDKVSTLSGWKKTKELGFINRSESLKLKQNSFAGLVTFLPELNHINAQPNKMFEYMASGLPIITSNFPLWKDIVENNNCGICVNPQDSSEIAAAITKLDQNRKLAFEMGENGKKAVLEKYNWKNEEKKLLELYANL
jgi:glycosyltransferase involved in cell wall biosynthesis